MVRALSHKGAVKKAYGAGAKEFILWISCFRSSRPQDRAGTLKLEAALGAICKAIGLQVGF